jgi:hypothetical protein
MSEQLTSQSRPSSGVSRRTALRGAAWSASAVTVVVATPNVAAASTPPPSANTAGTARREPFWYTFDTVTLNATLTHTGGPALVSPYVVLSATPGGLDDLLDDRLPGWTKSGNSMTWTLNGSLVPGTPVAFKPMVSLTGRGSTARTVVLSLHAADGELLDTLTFAFTRQTETVTGR